MRLQDFLHTDLRYDYQDIAADTDLSRQIQVRLIDMGILEPPADGIFGPVTSAALERFQTLMESGEPRYLGAITAKQIIETTRADLPANLPVLTVTRDTVFKARPLQSSVLPETEKQLVASGRSFKLIEADPAVRKHVRVTLRDDEFPKLHEDGAVKPSQIWYVFSEHAKFEDPGVEDESIAPKTPPKPFASTFPTNHSSTTGTTPPAPATSPPWRCAWPTLEFPAATTLASTKTNSTNTRSIAV